MKRVSFSRALVCPYPKITCTRVRYFSTSHNQNNSSSGSGVSGIQKLLLQHMEKNKQEQLKPQNQLHTQTHKTTTHTTPHVNKPATQNNTQSHSVIHKPPHTQYHKRPFSHPNIVWVDLEMTGLDITKDTILEMACIITDSNLNILAEGEEVIIRHPDRVLHAMDDWNTTHHSKSGLWRKVLESTYGMLEAEEKMIQYISKHVSIGSSLLAGNSVHVDKMYLDKHMPKFMSHLSHRIIDVSSLNELGKRWYPEEVRAVRKPRTHRALEDIKDSIIELKYYRTALFKNVPIVTGNPQMNMTSNIQAQSK